MIIFFIPSGYFIKLENTFLMYIIVQQRDTQKKQDKIADLKIFAIMNHFEKIV